MTDMTDTTKTKVQTTRYDPIKYVWDAGWDAYGWEDSDGDQCLIGRVFRKEKEAVKADVNNSPVRLRGGRGWWAVWEQYETIQLCSDSDRGKRVPARTVPAPVREDIIYTKGCCDDEEEEYLSIQEAIDEDDEDDEEEEDEDDEEEEQEEWEDEDDED